MKVGIIMDKLWEAFCKTGKISDYLKYHKYSENREGVKIDAADDNGSSNRGESLRRK